METQCNVCNEIFDNWYFAKCPECGGDEMRDLIDYKDKTRIKGVQESITSKLTTLEKLNKFFNKQHYANDDDALRWASENGHVEIVKLLLKRGANVHAENDYALRWASVNGHIKVIELLLNNGADVHADYGYAIRWASWNGHAKVVELLKAHMKKETS